MREGEREDLFVAAQVDYAYEEEQWRLLVEKMIFTTKSGASSTDEKSGPSIAKMKC